MLLILSFISLLLLAIVSGGINEDRKIGFLFVAGILVSLFLFCSRNPLTPDTVPYMRMYARPSAFSESIEHFYLQLNSFLNHLGVSFRLYIWIVNIGIVLIWIYCTKTILASYRYCLLGLLVYVSFFGIYYNAIILRASIGAAISYLAFVLFLSNKGWRSYLYYFLLIALASQFHSSYALFLIFPWFLNIRYSTRFLCVVSVASFLLPLIGEISVVRRVIDFVFEEALFSRRMMFYISGEMASVRSSLYGNTEVLYFLITLLLVMFRDKLDWKDLFLFRYYNFFLNVQVVGFCLMMIVAALDIPMGIRIAYNFLYFQFLPLAIVLLLSPKRRRQYCFVGAIIFSILNFYSLWNNTPSLMYL